MTTCSEATKATTAANATKNTGMAKRVLMMKLTMSMTTSTMTSMMIMTTRKRDLAHLLLCQMQI